MDKERLKEEIAVELRNLERLSGEMEEIINRFKDEPDFVETRAAGSILHDFYCGVEKILERIAIQIDGGLPKGEDWHTELLLQMAHPVPGVRRAVINQSLLEKLKEYLRFRHLFRHIYGFELKWDRFKDLALALSATLREFKISLSEIVESI